MPEHEAAVTENTLPVKEGCFRCALCGGDKKASYLECTRCGLKYCTSACTFIDPVGAESCMACNSVYMSDALLLRLLLGCFRMSRETALKLAHGHLLNGGGR